MTPKLNIETMFKNIGTGLIPIYLNVILGFVNDQKSTHVRARQQNGRMVDDAKKKFLVL